MSVNRDVLGVVLIAALAVVGLGLVAGTITDTYASDPRIDADQSIDGPSVQGPGIPGPVIDGGPNPDVPAPDDPSVSPLADLCFELLTQTPVIVGLVLGFLGLVALTYRQRGFIAAGFVGYLAGLPLVVGYGLTTQCGRPPGGSDDPGRLGFLGDFVASLVGPVAAPPAVLVGLFAVAAVAVIAVVASTAGSEDLAVDAPDGEDETGLEEFGAAAGAAADRIESTDASVDNAVYRAWFDLTTILDVDAPDTSTPGEFASAAVAAGVDERDVDDLTRLFEEVRYGDLDPEPREELALETLRHIEDTYGGTDDGQADE